MGVDSQLKPGTYTFAGGMSLDAIINQLTAGPVANALTIPEGSTLEAVAQSVATFTENRITADAFTAAASDASSYAADYDFLADAGTNSLEGFLFPKTYEIGDDATAESVVRMMLDQFKTETSGLDWSYPQSQGLTIYDAVKLASIVERESSGDEQIRAQVASVFYNRLNNFGDPNYGFLQSDATTAYELGHDPTPEDIKNPTPVSYTHLDVYKRQMLASIPAVAVAKSVFVYYFEKRMGRQLVSADGVFFQGTTASDGTLDPIADATSPHPDISAAFERVEQRKAEADQKAQHRKKR